MTIKRTMSLTLIALLCITTQSMTPTPNALQLLQQREMTGKNKFVSPFIKECMHESHKFATMTKEQKEDLFSDLEDEMDGPITRTTPRWPAIRIQIGALMLSGFRPYAQKNPNLLFGHNELIYKAVELADLELTQLFLQQDPNLEPSSQNWTLLHMLADAITNTYFLIEMRSYDLSTLHAMLTLLLRAGIDTEVRAKNLEKLTAQEMVQDFAELSKKSHLLSAPLKRKLANRMALAVLFYDTVEQWRAAHPAPSSSEAVQSTTQQN